MQSLLTNVYTVCTTIVGSNIPLLWVKADRLGQSRSRVGIRILGINIQRSKIWTLLIILPNN